MHLLIKGILAVGSLSACVTPTEERKISSDQQDTLDRQAQARSTEVARKNFGKQRQDYIQTASDDLNRLEEQIASIKARKIKNPEERTVHEDNVASLEGALAAARDKLADLDEASEDEWAIKQREVEVAIMTARASVEANQSPTH
ncbi:hypothetical protein E3A20_18700 [Planctomyces bekefii]|uniref:DUF4398 domain-containing protein n=1 Tax=Planctomyces bekefii TaxID=1653850 RepID=A0A5C6M7B4_9PLAN|nr:hypothetical protein E3A20_18700 [Planctomyces bekefii]